MKKTLSLKESILVGSMLFGMFFGAGNLIFPVNMGQMAGNNVFLASLGFIVTGVGLPLLGVACLGISRKDSLFELSSLVGEKYKYFFTLALYLTIGPFFAIPRCASTSFTVGMEKIIDPSGAFTPNQFVVPRLIFTFLFFAIVLLFALKPSGIMTWIGQYINPIFLVFLLALIIVSILNPMEQFNAIEAINGYETKPFFSGFIEGYNTMDAIASLAFGITVITVIRNLGIKDEKDIAFNTIKAGFIGCVLMAVIYIATAYMGKLSSGNIGVSENGGIALSLISNYYFGKFGNIFLLAVVTLACIKTSLALVISCSEMFNFMFKKFLTVKQWAVVLVIFSFVVSNFGLNAIIEYSIPVLMFLYPLTISIILLSLFGRFFNYDKRVFVSATVLNLISALFDFIKAFPKGILPEEFTKNVIVIASKILPFFDLGLGWLVPTIIGVVIGLLLMKVSKKA